MSIVYQLPFLQGYWLVFPLAQAAYRFSYNWGKPSESDLYTCCVPNEWYEFQMDQSFLGEDLKVV